MNTMVYTDIPKLDADIAKVFAENFCEQVITVDGHLATRNEVYFRFYDLLEKHNKGYIEKFLNGITSIKQELISANGHDFAVPFIGYRADFCCGDAMVFLNDGDIDWENLEMCWKLAIRGTNDSGEDMKEAPDETD